MTRLEAALLDITGLLEEERVPHMIIGGFANLHWGVERFTRDLDLTVEVADEALETFLRRLEARFALTDPDPLAFVRRHHLIRIVTPNGVPVDLMIATLPYESSAIRRAVAIGIGDRQARVCSPEDLIIHKLASDRPQDAVDVAGIVTRQAARLDRAYLDARVAELATGLERPRIVEFYRSLLARADATED